MASILEPPSAPAWRNPDGTLEDAYYGGGWMVRPKGANGRPNLWHTGCLPGTYTLMVQRGDGIGYAALFNQRSRDWETRDTVLDPLLYRAVDKVTNWPEDDLFNVNRAS
jgi:N-acyl-D-amino-acid deacylase